MAGAPPAAGSGPSVLAGAAGLVTDAIESALAAALEGLHSRPGEPAPSPPPSTPAARERRERAPLTTGAPPRPGLQRLGSPPAGASWQAARRPAEAATDLAASVAARIALGTLARLDLNAIIDRVDVGRVIAKVDVDAVLSRVDVEALLDKVDLDRLVQRLDVSALAKEAMDGIDVGDVIRESTMSIGGETVEVVRDQAMRADGVVARVVDRALGRTGT